MELGKVGQDCLFLLAIEIFKDCFKLYFYRNICFQNIGDTNDV